MAISPNLVGRMGFWTTGTDEMNSEISRFFANTVQMRASVLRLKLRVFELCNMATFRSDMHNKTSAQVRMPLALIRWKAKWNFIGKWADRRIARNNDDLINQHSEASWYGEGCNLMETMARDAMLISEWKECRKPVGRMVRKRNREQTAIRKKGAWGIGQPEE